MGETMALQADEALAHLRLAAERAGMRIGELVAPADRHVVLDGMRLHYLDWGNDGRPSLLFLHGGRLTAHTWDLVCLALRAEYHCLAVDLRGHGDSEWSPGAHYGIDSYVHDLTGLIDRLGLERPALIGQSLGGLIALTYATRTPARLAAVVAVDVASQVKQQGTRRITSFIADPGPAPVEHFVARALAADPSRDPRLLQYSLRHNLRQLPDGSWTWKYDQRRMTSEHFAGVLDAVRELGRHTQLIACPVLVVRGAVSDVLDPAQAARFAADLPDGRTVTVDSSGHNVQVENPRGLTRALTEFFKEIEGSPNEGCDTCR